MKGTFLISVIWILCFFSGDLYGDDLIQNVDDGFINWTELSVTLTGSGAPDLSISNTVSAKLSAEKAAKMNAVHRFAKALGKIVPGKGKTLEKYLSEIKDSSFLRELSKNAQWSSMTLDKQYSDGSVEYIFKFDLAPYLKEIILKTKDGFAKEVSKSAEDTTSVPVENKAGFLLIDMRKLKAGRVLFPSIETSAGEVISSFNDFHCAVKNADAMIAGLNAANHLKILPLKVKDGSTLIVSKEDALKIRNMLDADAFSEGRVIILFK